MTDTTRAKKITDSAAPPYEFGYRYLNQEIAKALSAVREECAATLEAMATRCSQSDVRVGLEMGARAIRDGGGR